MNADVALLRAAFSLNSNNLRLLCKYLKVDPTDVDNYAWQPKRTGKIEVPTLVLNFGITVVLHDIQNNYFGISQKNCYSRLAKNLLVTWVRMN
jgi:hypothetical protein